MTHARTDAAEAAFAAQLYAYLDALPRRDAAVALRTLGASVSDDPTAEQFRQAWRQIEPTLSARYSAFRAAGGSSEAYLRSLSSDKERIAQLEKENGRLKLTALMQDARINRDLSVEHDLLIWGLFEKGHCTLAAVPAMLDCFAPRTKWRGRTYDELRPMERAELHREDPELFERMRSASAQKGKMR